jgi:hypothetical protein
MGDVVPFENGSPQNELDRLCEAESALYDRFLLNEGLQVLATYRSIRDPNARRDIFNLIQITAARQGP